LKHHFAAVIVGQLFPIFVYYIPLLLHSLMTKRGKREGGDLTKDDLDLNDDRDTAAHHANPFPKATADVLANRRIIRTARRPVGTSVAATIASSSSAQAEEKPFNPFANISLVAPPPPPLPAPAMVAAVTEENSKTDENEELKIESKNGNEAVQPSSPSILNKSRVNQRSREAEEGNDKADETTKTSESSKRSRVTAASDAAAASNDAETTKTNTSESSSTTPVPLNTTGITTAPVFGSALAAAPAAATTSAVASSGFGSTVASGFGSALFGSSSIGGFGFAAATGHGFGSATAASGFGSLKPSSHAPFSFGASSLSATTANSTTTTTETTDPIASSTEPVVATLPETYQIQSGEEDEVCALEVRVRTWRKDTGTAATDASTTAPALVAPPAHASVPPSTATNFGATSDATTGMAATDTSTTVESSDDAMPKPAPVKLTEVGKGPLRILRRRNGNGSSSSSNSTRVVQRQELSPNGAATKVILNVRLYPGSTTFYVAPESNVHVRLVTVNQHNAPESYTFKFVGAADAATFVSTLNEILNEPSAESDTKQAAAAATDSVVND
jgi:NUP50 (Nucleoporin 50 kDa)